MNRWMTGSVWGDLALFGIRYLTGCTAPAKPILPRQSSTQPASMNERTVKNIWIEYADGTILKMSNPNAQPFVPGDLSAGPPRD